MKLTMWFPHVTFSFSASPSLFHNECVNKSDKKAKERKNLQTQLNCFRFPHQQVYVSVYKKCNKIDTHGIRSIKKIIKYLRRINCSLNALFTKWKFAPAMKRNENSRRGEGTSVRVSPFYSHVKELANKKKFYEFRFPVAARNAGAHLRTSSRSIAFFDFSKTTKKNFFPSTPDNLLL